MIIPALLAYSKEEFNSKATQVVAAVDLIQIDIMDGVFVHNEGWADPNEITKMELPVKFELHLMVQDPFVQLKKWSGQEQVQRVIAHFETLDNPREFIEACKSLGFECGLAINPETAVEDVAPFFSLLDVLLFLGVKPGKSGQNLKPEVIDKIKQAALYEHRPRIEIDGGVDEKTLPELKKAGAELFVVGSAIFNSNKAPLEALHDLEMLET